MLKFGNFRCLYINTMTIKSIPLLYLLLLGFYFSTAQVLPADRQVDWSHAGLKNNVTSNFTNVNLSSFGVVGNGVTPNDNAISAAIASATNSNGVILKFPSGNFLFNNPIRLQNNVVLSGEGPDNTTLIFDLGGSDHAIDISGSLNNTVQKTLTQSAAKNQTFLQLNNTNSLQIGDWIQLNQNDAHLVTNAWAEVTIGQITQIENIVNNRIFLSSPLRKDYAIGDEPTITKMSPIENVGISCLKIQRIDDTAPSQTSSIRFNYAVNSWVSGIESSHCTFSHIQARYSSNFKIEKSYFHDAFDFGGGGRAYGIMLHLISNEILVENNIFKRLRHAMILQAGANGNVLAFNYSYDPFWTTVPSDAAGDIVLHGNYVFANLFEQNIVQNMVIDNSHGPNGPNNTFIRNRGESFGIFFSADNSPGQNFLGNEVTNTESPYNIFNYIIQGDDHFILGNNNKGTIDPIGSATLSINSLYYFQRPSFVSAQQWGSIGLPNSLGSGTIPALERVKQSRFFAGACGEAPVNTSSINTEIDQLKIIPNPTSDQLKITSESLISKVELYDISGRFIKEKKYSTSTILFPLSEQTPGLYLLKVYTDSENPIVKKITKM